MEPMHVLVSLHKGYGLGDAVQVSSVLQHIAKYKKGWTVDFQAEEGRHCVGRGIVANIFAFGTPYPHTHYDAECEILLFDTWYNWHDRPNTRVSSCLQERFGLDWDAECGRYQVYISEKSTEAARTLLSGWSGCHRGVGHYSRTIRHVAIHYDGDSCPEKKNLTNSQADKICQAVEKLRYEPVILDWRKRSPLGHRKITTPEQWGGDAEMVCAVISQCAAFVCIDCGPDMCASATNTPALVVWTGHHPAPFHDPAPNTTHLVPSGYHDFKPVCNNRGVVDWFDAHYNVRQYEKDPAGEICVWLKEVLG